MRSLDEVLAQYDSAIERYANVCTLDPSSWHLPDFALFSLLFDDLLPHAKEGSAYAQYALAWIALLGLRSDSESDYRDRYYRQLLPEATKWWLAAAKQGHLAALDNLASVGVGPMAKRARQLFSELRGENGWVKGSDIVARLFDQ